MFLDHTISFDLIGPYLHTHIVFVAACRGRLFKKTLTYVNLVFSDIHMNTTAKPNPFATRGDIY